MIKVTAAHDRRRAGRFFPKGQPITLDPDELSDAEQLAILEDAVLNVQPVEPELDDVPQLSDEERSEKILATIPELTDAQKNKNGDPNVKALSKAVGFDVTKAEVDAALEALTAAPAE